MTSAAHRRDVHTGAFAASGGVSLRYTRYGSGPEALVVIPGIDDAVQNLHALPWFWAWYFRPLVERGHSVYLISRARGLSERLQISDLAELYADVIERHIGPAHVLGISMGGMIAQHIALGHPRLVRRLILAVTAHRLAETGHTHGEQLMTLARSGRWLAFARLSNQLCFSGSLRLLVAFALWLATPAAWVLERRARSAARVRRAQDFCNSANACALHDTETMLSRIQAPTLIWGASADPLFPAAALEHMTALLPGARLVTVDGAHAAFLQERAHFQRCIADFLEQPPGRSA